MQYSSGIFNKESDSLYQSQLNKIDALIAKTKVRKDEHVLEVGCGWGAFAIRAAQTTGCRVTGVTISTEQFDEATKRVKEAGLSDRISIVFSDYRLLEEKFGPSYFDHAVSCEMIEAVGHEHLPGYFKMLSTMIKEGGRVAIQAISIKDDKYAAQLKGCDFIKRHIFPGSVLPSMQIMKSVTHGQTALRMDEVQDIGLSYATTLRMWHEAWIKGEKELKSSISPLGVVYDDVFYRKWRFYFAYCEAAFGCQYIHNYQISWAKKDSAEVEATAAPVAMSMPFVSIWLFLLSVLSTVLSVIPARGSGKQGVFTMAVPVVVLAVCAFRFAHGNEVESL